MGRLMITCVSIATMLVVVGAGKPSGVSASAKRYPGDRCPAAAVHSVAPMGLVSMKAEALIPHAFSRELNRAQRKGFVLTEVVWLAPGAAPASSRTNALRRVARRSCGEATAEVSWAVAITFPNIPLPTARQEAFVVKTSRGWRLYRPLA
jgi:hypothetical protein